MNDSQRVTLEIGCAFPDYFPEMIVEDMLGIPEERPAGLVVQRVPMEAYAAIEWVLMTGVVAWVSKSYFESFLKEAGKDHYQLLSNWLKGLVGKSRMLKTRAITASQSPERKGTVRLSPVQSHFGDDTAKKWSDGEGALR